MSLIRGQDPTPAQLHDGAESATAVRWPEPSPLQGWWDEVMSSARRGPKQPSAWA
ncbi:hypothetical protein DFR75_10756 [Nocardia ignorata]|uniref:Uncharacterized protein n=1 Tax=Nocardia ignorata TaxID=145285 RepID=A0A4R6P2T8_NOCIG|nr:hypothetical protein DFR75_10756 [Nocardia ignorata]